MSPTEPKELRTGWTTGTCASAAAKAAVQLAISGVLPLQTEVPLPSGLRVIFAIEDSGDHGAVVVKDAGDDPDCTDGARITAHARVLNDSGALTFLAGTGVGVISKPGLGLEVGAPAINPVPKRMITEAVREVSEAAIELTFSVPGGEEMAKRTTNERLGIIGGISILGTTGIVRPFSTAAYRASVVQQIDVASAQGEKEIVLATGSRSEQCAMGMFPHLDKVCFVEVGDFTGVALKRAANKGVSKVVWVGMVGKISKLANEVMMTHFHRSDLNNQVLLQAAKMASASNGVIESATATNTARHFYEVCLANGEIEPLHILCVLAKRAIQSHVADKLLIDLIMVDFDGKEVVTRA